MTCFRGLHFLGFMLVRRMCGRMTRIAYACGSRPCAGSVPPGRESVPKRVQVVGTAIAVERASRAPGCTASCAPRGKRPHLRLGEHALGAVQDVQQVDVVGEGRVLPVARRTARLLALLGAQPLGVVLRLQRSASMPGSCSRRAALTSSSHASAFALADVAHGLRAPRAGGPC